MAKQAIRSRIALSAPAQLGTFSLGVPVATAAEALSPNRGSGPGSLRGPGEDFSEFEA
ncbi:hypothetical protein GCM10009716_40020 [Streptomyces sodiiphilus]|uniref:Uncharacterized protein n=1 Tax=Streptomyces sodiiphilus TaxID=226217 RepID=A0ABP5B112_9ACTN